MERLFDAIHFIEVNIYEPITIHDVAKASNYSTYHFSRIFRTLVGDSPKEYLRKRRLTIAAERLAQGEKSILNLALDCQFESQEAFTRAFKALFNMTPGQYRSKADPFRLAYRDQFSPHMLRHLQENLTMQPEIVERPEIKAIGIAGQYSQEDLDYPKLWIAFRPYAEAVVHRRVGGHFFGIHEQYQETDDGVEFTYVCAMEVEDFEDVPEGMVTRTIPAQLYAVFTHDDDVLTIPETMKYIWGSWLPKSKYEYVERPDFELFPKTQDPNGQHKPIFLYVPIRREGDPR